MLTAALLLPALLRPQKPETIPLTVEDSRGAAIAGASVLGEDGKLLGLTGQDGRLQVICSAPCRLRIQVDGFAPLEIVAASPAEVRLDPAALLAQVTVTAYRVPLGLLESPVTTRQLSQQALAVSPSFTLDGQLRQLPGVELFRRSSSLVANPSSQGLSLRGLGSTSASRTLLTMEDVPLNDPVGGWIHWEEQPEMAIAGVDAVRGGASDLYGSSAIGGVVNLLPVRPTVDDLRLRSSYGALGTFDSSAFAALHRGPWGLMATGGAIGTQGFIQVAPSQRGPVDTPSNLHAWNGLAMGEHLRGPLRLFANSSGFHESRANGTAFQVNDTRLFRYSTGADWQGSAGSSATARLYGSRENFHQTFSSVSSLPVFGDPGCSARCGEKPTRISGTPDNELGASLRWNRPLAAGLLLVLGSDLRDVRVWDREQSLTGAGTLTNLSVHQRAAGVYAESMWQHRGWTFTAAGRLDLFQNFDLQQRKWNGAAWTQLPPQPSSPLEHPFDPRIGLSRQLGTHWALSASAFRAFRAPTPNELYRSTQVGNKLTTPNSSLRSERATGWETGLAAEWNRGVVRASYFDTQVNRPITAFTVNLQSNPILLERENLGQIESRGLSLDFELKPLSWLSADGGYQFAHATVTRGTQDLGNWIPEVARNMAALGLGASHPRIGLLRIQGRLGGRQYDDDANLFLLHGFVRLDAYASRQLGRRIELFAAGENLLDRQIEVARTPSTTLATPRTLRGGFTFQLGAAGHPQAR